MIFSFILVIFVLDILRILWGEILSRELTLLSWTLGLSGRINKRFQIISCVVWRSTGSWISFCVRSAYDCVEDQQVSAGVKLSDNFIVKSSSVCYNNDLRNKFKVFQNVNVSMETEINICFLTQRRNIFNNLNFGKYSEVHNEHGKFSFLPL